LPDNLVTYQNDPTPAVGFGFGVDPTLLSSLYDAIKTDVGSGVNALRNFVSTPANIYRGKYSLNQINELAPGYALGLAGAGIPTGAALVPEGDILGAFTAYHGTPHRFEPVEHNPFGEFRDEAIGSGEGAQSYGYGHYVAGNQNVAKSYARSSVLASSRAQDIAERYLQQTNDNFGKALDLYLEKTPQHEQSQEVLDILNNPTSLLEVHVKPDEEDLLHWDKPLQEQSPKVIETLRKFDFDPIRNRDWSGQDIYDNIATQEYTKRGDWDIPDPRKLASKALHEAGIPGIRYLDQGSRNPPNVYDLQSQLDYMKKQKADAEIGEFGAIHGYNPPSRWNPDPKGYNENFIKDVIDPKIAHLEEKLKEAKFWKPTHNYVIFDPSNLTIIGRNGERLVPVDHDPFASELK